MQAIRPYVQKGTHRLLAVIVDKRLPQAPELPTVKEVLPAFEKPASWIGVFAPAALPPSVLTRLSSEFAKASHTPKVRAYMESGGNELIASTHAEALATVKKDLAQTARAMKVAGIQPE
ncbi:MAG: hypothetical protein A3H91_17725 [Gammaproteobacteria bacterium RIFCSPLOWO2_02_FULL_61_13]|nr:MAG: hypothetical protein A3H91_17725 [Gammaproteobacteria bacterium RIFCSPLOWO2_02_FULL_61_13]